MKVLISGITFSENTCVGIKGEHAQNIMYAGENIGVLVITEASVAHPLREHYQFGTFIEYAKEHELKYTIDKGDWCYVTCTTLSEFVKNVALIRRKTQRKLAGMANY